jgi:hypothetical protein
MIHELGLPIRPETPFMMMAPTPPGQSNFWGRIGDGFVAHHLAPANRCHQNIIKNRLKSRRARFPQAIQAPFREVSDAARQQGHMDHRREHRARRWPGRDRLGPLAARWRHLSGQQFSRMGGVLLRWQRRHLDPGVYRLRLRRTPSRSGERLAVSSGISGDVVDADVCAAELARASAIADSTSACVSGPSIG